LFVKDWCIIAASTTCCDYGNKKIKDVSMKERIGTFFTITYGNNIIIAILAFIVNTQSNV